MEFRCLGLCTEEQWPVLVRGAELFGEQTGLNLALEHFLRREDLLYRLREGRCDTAIVALPGALGMESVLGVRGLNRHLPLIWISDDEVFAMQSYRLGVQMFLRFPVTSKEVAGAMARCACPAGFVGESQGGGTNGL